MRMPLARSITLRSSSAVRARSSSSRRRAKELKRETQRSRMFLMRSLRRPPIGGDAGVDGSLDRGLVALIDEHGDGSLHRPADLEHLLEHVAARVLEVDQDDVGVEGVDASEHVRRLAGAHHVHVAGLAQPVLQDRRADRILINDDDLERRLHGRGRRFSSRVPSPVERRFSSSINSLSAKPSTARRSAGAPMVEYWAAALSKDAAPTPSPRMSTGGAFRLRPNRAFMSARWFSPDAPPGRPRSSDEQGAAWNKAWQCGGFEVPAIVAAGSLRNFKSKTTLDKFAGVPLIPKFASEGAAKVCELRNRDTRCASTRTCTSTRNTRGRRAGISISSIS